ncbi:MAG: hypothetical protein P8Q14_01945 [Vicingaceae bacterium]|nr:hypothetical protein [Vicingaceae bacterium]
MHLKSLLISILLLSGLNSFSQTKSEWSVEANLGLPINLSHPITIKQQGHPDLNFKAKFYSKPFKQPFFYVYRFSKWKNDKGWQLEMMHQKLYLKNPPKEVQYFSITHGYNLIMLSRAFKVSVFKEKDFIFSVGSGIILAHAENMVRGKEFDQEQSFNKMGYYLTGPVLNLAIAKRINLSNRFYLNIETKFNTSYAKVPIVDGEAWLVHSAFSFIGGVGYTFIK